MSPRIEDDKTRNLGEVLQVQVALQRLRRIRGPEDARRDDALKVHVLHERGWLKDCVVEVRLDQMLLDTVGGQQSATKVNPHETLSSIAQTAKRTRT